jgi:hypothetical protein
VITEVVILSCEKGANQFKRDFVNPDGIAPFFTELRDQLSIRTENL